MTMTIGKRVRLFRTNLGLTQPIAAEHAGISHSAWSRIETGQKTPTAGEVLGISWALGVPIETIRGKGAIRDRIRFAARTTNAVADTDRDAAEAIKEEMIFLAGFAAELTDAGYLTARRK
jgi:transcriptional regulator with XRE-family HTH domain